MSVATASLITLTEAKLFPGMGSLPATDEALIEALIDAASLDFETHWDNYGVQRSVAEKYTYHQIITEAPNYDKIWLRKFPIASITSIADPAANTIDSDEYVIDYDIGCLRSTAEWGWDVPLDSNGFESYWTITYTPGRVANTAAVPANIKLACKMWTAILYKNATQNVQSKSVGDFSITYKGSVDGGLPDQIKRMISAWKKRDA